jgi:type 1 glutamine amidotransferase
VTVLGTCEEEVGGARRAEPMFWTREHGKGRVFVCILGHYIWTFDDPLFRILLLRGMAWAAGDSPYRLDPIVLRGASVK